MKKLDKLLLEIYLLSKESDTPEIHNLLQSAITVGKVHNEFKNLAVDSNKEKLETIYSFANLKKSI